MSFSGDYREELKKLNHSLLAKILEYFQLAAANQNDSLNQTLSDIHKLAGNFFYVLNTLKDGIKVKISKLKRVNSGFRQRRI